MNNPTIAQLASMAAAIAAIDAELKKKRQQQKEV